MEKEQKNKTQKQRKPMDKRKLAQNIIVILLVLMMVLSVGATLIYYLLNL